ncbi:RHS repeat domain-containing protein [Epilithonimonas mollis]|uniref:RHS repeat-associated core domain-containing protein n=1 Tax=Epilithonimonas mollis TaxID=216903 RepID=A0A1M6TKN2_9FLAO|nr:pre-toxin TG domain-containing protein [Epilithonimonas mollis]SHK57507.1 RHS repeat-associated core domain-containing protein [Epilithonimonas mollis]
MTALMFLCCRNYYYGARYYDPNKSIWLSVDPLAVYNPVMETEFYGDGEHNGGVFNSFNNNSYIYCYQNPILLVDPNGKQTMAGALRGVPYGEINNVEKGWRDGLRKGGYQMDFVPGFGDGKGVIEGIVGTDMQGNKLSTFDRVLSLLLLSELKNTKIGIKALSDVEKARKIVTPKWGAKIADYGTNAMEHIKEGHFFDSRKGQKSSRFLQSLSNPGSVKELVQEAVAKGKHIGGEDNYKVIHTFDDVIGTTSDGKKTKTIQIYLDKAGNVKNAFPIPNSKK